MQTSRWTILGILLATVHAPSAVSFAIADEPSLNAEQLLNRAAAAVRLPSGYVIKSEVIFQARYEGTGVQVRTSKADDTVPRPYVVTKYAHPDGRMHITVDRSNNTASMYHEIILNNEYALLCRCSGYSADKASPERAFVRIARTAQDLRKWKNVIDHEPRYGEFLNAMLPDGTEDGASVIELAQRGTLNPAVGQEKVGEWDCLTVSSMIPGGQVHLWIAPSKGYNLAKWTIEWKDQPLPRYRDFHASFEATGFLEIDGRIIPAGGRLKSYDVAQSESEEKQILRSWQTVEARRLFIDFHPEFDEPWLFTPAHIPDGTPVRFTDEHASPLRYIWQGGQPVIRIGQGEQQLLEQIDQEIRKYFEIERQTEKKEGSAH